MVGVFANLVDELMDIELMAQQDDVSQEDWGWQVDALFQKYALLLVGVDPPAQSLM